MIIANHGYHTTTARRLSVERVWIYRPQTAWFYSHHPSLAFFKGRYYAIWSNGRRDEDAPGQRVLIASSEDFQHWTEPAPLLETQPGQHGERVLTAAEDRG
jgi:hypothetical protein